MTPLTTTEDEGEVALHELEGPLSRFALEPTSRFLRDLLTPLVDAGIVVELQELEQALSASFDVGDMEVGEKPMYSFMGFSSSTVQWVDGGVDAADGPQTSRGSTWLWFLFIWEPWWRWALYF